MLTAGLITLDLITAVVISLVVGFQSCQSAHLSSEKVAPHLWTETRSVWHINEWRKLGSR
jgi:sulfite reductase beta subunit-like hemoprotein